MNKSKLFGFYLTDHTRPAKITELHLEFLSKWANAVFVYSYEIAQPVTLFYFTTNIA